ncbi:Arc-like DNA binding domain protein [compost metagenome]
MSLNGNSRTADKFVVRLPDGMRERIAEIAAANHRSMNSEVVLHLKTLIEDAELDLSESTTTMATCMEEVHALHAFRSLSKDKRQAMLTLLSSDQ